MPHITHPRRKLSRCLLAIAGVTLASISAVCARGSRDITDAGGGLIRLTVTQAAMNEKIRQAVDQSIQIVERRVNELGTVEPTIQREGSDRILVQVPGLGDPQRLIDIVGKTAKLTFRLVDLSMSPEQALGGNTPPDSEILYEDKTNRPVLVEKCYSCHSREHRKNRGGLYVDSRSSLLEGGQTGPGQAGDPVMHPPPESNSATTRLTCPTAHRPSRRGAASAWGCY